MTMETLSEHVCFGGVQGFYRHGSDATGTSMKFGVFVPPQARTGPVPVLFYLAGLTCSEESFAIKAGAQAHAARHGLMLVTPDTSPRDTGIDGADAAWDFGTAAGFYLDATHAPWATHWRMERYVTDELRALVLKHFNARPDRVGIFGHSPIAPSATVISDGLWCFGAVQIVGADHERVLTGGGKARLKLPQFKAVNTYLGNLKRSLSGTYHAFDFAKYAISLRPSIDSTVDSICTPSCLACCAPLAFQLLFQRTSFVWLRLVANQEPLCIGLDGVGGHRKRGASHRLTVGLTDAITVGPVGFDGSCRRGRAAAQQGRDGAHEQERCQLSETHDETVMAQKWRGPVLLR
jgi:hypothetical protein